MQNLASIASTVQKTFKQVGAACVTGVKRSAYIVGYVNKYLLVAVANTIHAKYLGQKKTSADNRGKKRVITIEK